MTVSLSSTDSITPDDFFTGNQATETKQVTIKVGEDIEAREVLAIESTTGKYVTYAEGGSNGTNVAVAISSYAVDASSAEQEAQVYSAGSFNPELLVFSGTPSDLQIANMFVDSPIVLQKPQG